ncbi:uracil-DNA glycosylase [Paenibacillus sp. tmac-D7]|uniref:uracil-DNA glycosylase n=1 Tax=Paenibacillus sp. tmac-D7 TaxID=2591462 RepID=UPI00114298D3|nr:uracil-DNA glycosylase [Paenibacillus sp. tmac-D7]
MNQTQVNQQIANCLKCDRLVLHRITVGPNGNYWSRGVPGFGDANAEILIVGLAPGAHGANRTGRPFTGDFSGDMLFAALYHASLCNQVSSIDNRDGMKLNNVYLTNIVKCAPPKNRPSLIEIRNCRSFFMHELELLSNVKVILVFGELALKEVKYYFSNHGIATNHVIWEHGALYQMGNGLPKIKVSYHPSRLNFISPISKENKEKRMTEDKLQQILRETVQALPDGGGRC